MKHVVRALLVLAVVVLVLLLVVPDSDIGLNPGTGSAGAEGEAVSGQYILDNRKAVPCDDLMAWGRWMQTGDRRVANTVVGEVRVSTVFLGLDHAFGDPSPLLFETMIFGGAHDEYQRRCSTWEQAEVQHAAALALVTDPVHSTIESMRQEP